MVGKSLYNGRLLFLLLAVYPVLAPSLTRLTSHIGQEWQVRGNWRWLVPRFVVLKNRVRLTSVSTREWRFVVIAIVVVNGIQMVWGRRWNVLVSMGNSIR